MIEKSRSPWVCPNFYANNYAKQIRDKIRIDINYTKLNEAFMPTRYPIPNKESPFHKIQGCNIFSKFDLKSGFWQIGIAPNDRYKTNFVVSHGQYQWRVVSFGLPNAYFEF
jgi:hypothetical protein